MGNGVEVVKEWFALHTRPYSERKVAVRLGRYDIETYVPLTESESDRSDAKPVPFFPGYMFMHVDMDEANPNHWRFTPGVRYIVSYGNEPVAVPEELVQTVRQELDALHERRGQPRGRFEPGERVRITSGPLKDMVAIFDGPTEPAERVHVLLEVMSRYKRIDIAESALEKAGSDQEKQKGRPPRRTRGRGRRIRS